MDTAQLLFFLRILTILVVIIVLILLRAQRKHGGISATALAGLVAFWSLVNLLDASKALPMRAEVLSSLNYFCLTSAATLQIIFTFSYTNRKRWLALPVLSLFGIEPLATQILFWIPQSRAYLFDAQTRIWEQINLIYILHLLAASLFILADTFLNKPRAHLKNAGSILVGAFLPMLGTLFLLVMRGLHPEYISVVIFSYALAVAGFVYGKFNSRLVEASPATRDVIVESMDDGWMVVDQTGKVIDLNPAAERLVGMSRDKIYGSPVEDLLPDWTKVLHSPEGVKDLEVKRTVKSQKDLRYLNIRISQLLSENQKPQGHLVVWRDVTERTLELQSRQRARDELFVLLNAISSLASSATQSEEFIKEACYQIVYSFQSQIIVVFLAEQSESASPQKLELNFHFGIPPEAAPIIQSRAFADGVYRWLTQNEENQPLLVERKKFNFGMPVNPAELGVDSALLIPLVIYTQKENNILGCLLLGRSEGALYTEDEVVRLTTIANQISTLIDSDRRRQFSITLKERERIMRDLHDSVSQKLYGLVALSEAAQAAVEAGVPLHLEEFLAKMGENARQAVKEMRLFLFEMQPRDLKDGLASSLQYRLNAVEGRADIKVKMTSDEYIDLEKHQEIALYHIAQEALNNVMRHANPRHVNVNLRQTRRSVVLEITDDGKGFDLDSVDKSGLGLRNMRARALQANGEFQIISKPGMGTHVIVTVPRRSKS